MALIKCPECGQTISDKALKCPKCGYPIQTHVEKSENESANECLENNSPIDALPGSIPKKKKNIVIAVVLFLAIIFLFVLILCFNLFLKKLTVGDITINKWRLIDSTNYSDIYEGTISSEQKKPFVAVIGEYKNEKSIPQFVYIEDGIGVIETYEDTDEDPSIKYRPIGYLAGDSIKETDVKVQYADSDYYDSNYSESTSCLVSINIELNNSKNGLLIFDIVNETNNNTDINMTAVVINGKAKYSYYADLPYKSRGIDITVIPKLFCKSVAITEDDYVIEKPYTAEKKETSYSNSYSGEEILSFKDYADGFVLYTRELKEGGSKESRNNVEYLSNFLCDGECTLKTYDYVDKDKSILMPQYEFKIIGYITWEKLKKENV